MCGRARNRNSTWVTSAQSGRPGILCHPSGGPSCFFFRQIYDFPRLVLNECNATSTDTIHRMKSKGPPELIVASIYTHLTAASAEIEGRSYGGGVLELEPTEAEKLLVPAVLDGGLSVEECDRLIRAGRLAEVSRRERPLDPRAKARPHRSRIRNAASNLGENEEPPDVPDEKGTEGLAANGEIE